MRHLIFIQLFHFSRWCRVNYAHLRALISKKLEVDKQGSILSNLQGLQSLGGVLGIAMAGRVYDSFGLNHLL